MESEPPIVLLTTAGTKAQAESLAEALVERRLAACVNVIDGLCSIFRWKGRVEREAECLLVIKSVAGRLDSIEAALADLHTYEVPELIVLPVTGGSASYLDWLREAAAD